MVHFVGAGPGAPDLITQRGAALLQAADCIIYAGSLVNPALLGLARADCAIYNSAEMTLEQVAAVMKENEAAHKDTVRLHTGDPCLYGAIREQMDLLDAWGIAYDDTPGVSSFCGAAAALNAEYTLPGGSQTLWLAVWRVCIVLGVAVLGAVLVRHRGRRVLAAAALVLCAACYLGEWRINRWTYAIPAESAAGASALNESLAALDGKVLFLPCGVRQRDSQLIETYVARDVYIVEYETLLQSGALADGVLDLTAEAVGPEYPGRAYTDLDAADWVLAADGVPVDTTTLEKADAVCPAGYVLYRNLDAQRVRFAVS